MSKRTVNGFVIEDSVPPPIGRSRRGTGMKELVREMKKGDSVLLTQFTHSAQASSVRMAARLFPDRQYTCRAVEGGVRVWRLK